MNDTHFAYDDALTVTDPLGNVTVNTYDDLNRLLSTTATPSVGDDIVVSYAYDQVGNRTRQTDGRDCIVRFTYDGLNRLTGETVPSRTQDNRTRTFDDVGNLLSVTHAGGTWRDTAQTYDALNRVVSETSSGLTHTHTYDKANNRLTTTYDKTGRVLTRTYDPGNRLLTQEDVLSGEPTRLTVFAYDPQGNLLVKTLTDSSTENRTFDVRNRVTELHVKEPDGAATRLLQIYEYDLAGNLIALEESSAVGSLPTRVLTCAYDGTHRLIVEADQRGVDPAIVTNYTYDKADNRISREVFGGPEVGTTTYAIGNGGNGTGANQIASLTRPDTSVVAFTYDLTGARTSRTEDTRTDAYSYDVWNRLLTLDLQTSATPGDRGLYEYSYDARTRRVSREELSTPTVLSFQGGVSIQEYAASPGTNVGGLPSPTVEYVRGPDQGGGVGGILYSVRGGAASLAHSSARGDVVAKVDESTSTMTWQAQYEAFGRRPEESGTNADRQRANSKDEDSTGLLNEGFRYRDLETGTFITRDPAGFVDGPNLYTYVRQNPWSKWDPHGLNIFGDWAKTVSGIAKNTADAIDADAPPIFKAYSRMLRIPQGVTGAIGELINKNDQQAVVTAKAAGTDYLKSSGLYEAVNEDWQRTPTGAIPLPKSLVNVVENSNSTGAELAADAKNGMHGWHAQTNATLANKLGGGVIGAQIAAGILHEVDPFSVKAEVQAQGGKNAALDALGDIGANLLGILYGTFTPPSMFDPKVARELGGQVPGPPDPNPTGVNTGSQNNGAKSNTGGKSAATSTSAKNASNKNASMNAPSKKKNP